MKHQALTTKLTRSGFAAAVLGALVLLGCSGGSEGQADSAEQLPLVSWEEYEQAATRIVDGEKGYVVEWDLPVTEAELRERYTRYTKHVESVNSGVAQIEQPAIVNRVNNADDVWQNGQQRNLTYCVSDAFGADKARAVSEMAQATAAWERVALVNFNYLPAHDANCVDANNAVVIPVRPWTSSGACAFFPSGGGCVGAIGLLVMNFSSLPLPEAPNAASLGAFRHELGHILGLRHEQTRPESGVCVENSNWRPLTTYDQASVMHYPWCNGISTSTLSITSRDALGVGLLYGGVLPPAAGNPTGYVRSDSIPAVVYRNSSSQIRELALTGSGWGNGNLTAAPGAALSSSEPSAYVRADRINAVVYRSSNNHVRELALAGGSWGHNDLNVITGAPNAVGSPAAYMRSDGVSSVLYRSADNNIRELSLAVGGNWGHGNLSAIAGAALAASDPVGYVRHDAVNAVIYRSTDNHIRELALVGSSWVQSDLSAITGAPAATGRPSAYVRADGVTAVVYRSTDNHIRELALGSIGGWGHNDLSAISGAPAAGSDPVGYQRGDGVNAIVFRSSANQIWEIALSGTWGASNLSSITGAPAATGKPGAYVRADGVSAVVFRSSDNHIRELHLVPGFPWGHGDLGL